MQWFAKWSAFTYKAEVKRTIQNQLHEQFIRESWSYYNISGHYMTIESMLLFPTTPSISFPNSFFIAQIYLSFGIGVELGLIINFEHFKMHTHIQVININKHIPALTLRKHCSSLSNLESRQLLPLNPFLIPAENDNLNTFKLNLCVGCHHMPS